MCVCVLSARRESIFVSTDILLKKVRILNFCFARQMLHLAFSSFMGLLEWEETIVTSDCDVTDGECCLIFSFLVVRMRREERILTSCNYIFRTTDRNISSGPKWRPLWRQFSCVNIRVIWISGRYLDRMFEL